MPAIDTSAWRLTHEELHPADATNACPGGSRFTTARSLQGTAAMTKGWRIALFVCACLVRAAHGQDAISIEDLRTAPTAGTKRNARAGRGYYLGRRGVSRIFKQPRTGIGASVSGRRPRATSLGLMYARGLGFEKNLAKAPPWWSLAAAQNDPGAQHKSRRRVSGRPGRCLRSGAGAALVSARRERGHVLSQRMLGLMLYDGEGTQPTA
jgi:hypothetical protein